MSDENGDYTAVLGEDIVLKEKEQLTDLLSSLPLKAQLGFSALKEKWSNRGDKGLKQIISAAAKNNDPLVVEYTCIDVTPSTIVFGSNLGVVYLYDRATRKLSRFVCDQKQVPITAIRLLESRYFVATGQFSGAVTLFHFGEERNGQMKVNLKCTVESHHQSPVTCIQWTPDGMKLFTADSEGNVAITVLNMDEGKTHTVFICKEDSPVVQLSFCHTALLISTLRRTLIWPFNTKKIVQVGMQERKVFGNFGACFFPAAGPLPTDEQVDIYAARPGLRLWRATIDGKVLTTMMFRDSINKGLPEIQTLDLPTVCEMPVQQGDQKQFGPIKNFHDQFLITWQGSCVWVLDPTTGVVIGCHSNLGCVVDVGVCDNEIYVLSKGKENFVRKIIFEINPCILVEELDLNDPNDVMKAQRASSVSQFEDQDRFDKMLDEVGSKMNRALFDVKTRVKGIKEQIRSREVSEDDRGSESDRFSSPRAFYKKDPSGERCLAASEGYSTGEDKSEDFLRNGASSDDNDYSDRPFDSSNESLNSSERSPDSKSQRSEENVDNFNESHPNGEEGQRNNHEKVLENGQETQQPNEEGTPQPNEEEAPQTMHMVITHKKRETEPVFGHLSKEDFPQDIVFEGTSLGTVRKMKKKKKKTKKAATNDDHVSNNVIVPPSNITDVVDTNVEEIPTKTTDTVDSLNANTNTDDGDNKVMNLDSDCSSPVNKDIPNIENTNIDTKVKLENTDFDSNVKLGNTEPLEEHCSIDTKEIELVSGNGEIPLLTGKISDVTLDETDPLKKIENDSTDTHNEALSETSIESNNKDCSTPNGLLVLATSNESSDLDTTTSGVEVNDTTTESISCDDSKMPNLPSPKSIKSTNNVQTFTEGNTQAIEPAGQQLKDNLSLSLESEAVGESSNLKPSPLAVRTKLSASDSFSARSSPSNAQPKEPVDMNVVNVKISRHQRQGSNVSIASLSERCREIKGEAIEHPTARSPTDDGLLLGRDDSLEANMHRHDEPLAVVEHRNHSSDEDDGKLYPASPFPPPQTSNQSSSIYSQRSISLSEFSLENPEEIEDEDEKLLEDMMEYDRIDVQNDLIESIDSITDIEDNDSPPPVDIDEQGVAKTIPVPRRKRKTKTRNSYPSSPSGSDLEGRPVLPKESAAPESIRDRLRYLADSWADVVLPNNCGQIQSLACSSMLVWLIDNVDQVYYSPAVLSQSYTWKKLDGKAMQIASSQNGSVVWCIDRNNVAYYRVGIKEGSPQGSSWEPFEKNVHYLAVDKDSVWVIKKNGDVFVRTGVSNQRPYGSGWVTIKANSDLVQITCTDGIIWALDIYNHVQIFQGDLRTISVSDPSEHDLSWSELPGIAASHVNLGSKAVCWIIDRDNGVWFNQDVSRENPSGGNWYQLSLGENQSPEATWFSSVLSYFTSGNEPKMIMANDVAGVMILGKQGSIHVAHGHLLGTRWETALPTQVKTNSCWTCISAAGADMNKGYIWALQPNGQLFCFKSGRQSYNVQPPNRIVLKYCSAGPRSLWALTSGQDVYVRLGISETCPQGLKWLKVDMLAQGNRRLMNICAGNHVVWAVDFEGNAWFQMGREDRRGAGYAPAWVPVEGCPVEDGSKFTKIVVGPDDFIVWACDNKNNVYARKDVTENFWVGTSWEIVSGTSGKDLAISSNHVWSLCPNGDVLCRFGVSTSNVSGDYWKKVPGNFETISVGANDELWGIDRFGHLYQRETLLFYGSTLTCRAPSYDDLFSDHNDWEFI